MIKIVLKKIIIDIKAIFEESLKQSLELIINIAMKYEIKRIIY